jgi:glycosyltransferase 2 family protein
MTAVEARQRHVAGLERGAEGSAEEETLSYQRSPLDLLRVIVYGVVAVLLIALTIWVEDSLLGFEQDLLRLFDFLSPAVERVLHGALEWIGLCIAAALLAWTLATRRYRLLLYVAIAYAVAGGLMWAALRLLGREDPVLVVNEIAARAGVSDATSSGETGFAQFAAAFVVLGPFVSARWRQTGAGLLAFLVLIRFLVASTLPGNVLVSIPLGATVGAAILLALGRPDRRPTENAIRLALDHAGLPVTDVRPAVVDARGSTPYFATSEDGQGLFVKVLGEAERAADLMFRLYRFLRLRDAGDDRPFSSLRRTVEHEALVSLVARDVGVRTPRMRGVVRVGLDSMLLAYDRIDGRSLDVIEPAEISDEVMRDVCRQVGVLRRHRIAHRDLRRANVFVTPKGEVWLIDFGFAELAVDDAALDAEVAQVLAALAIVAGPERPVRIAIEVLGRHAVADALPRLQLQALSGATRSALKERKGLLADLQHEVQTQTGVTEVHFAELERLDKRMVLMVAVLAGATYFLLPQFADLPGIVQQVENANWGWLPLILLMSLVTYVGAAASLAGAVPQRVQAGPLGLSQVASEFASKLAPASVGGMALNVRFLQKQGVDRPVAVSGVGLSTVAGLVAHVSLIGVFIVWAGRQAFGSFRLPDLHWFFIGLLAVLVLAGIGLAFPYSRHILTQRLLPVLRRAFDGVTEVVRRPAKLLLLFGGSVLVSLGNLLALYFSVAAFGGGLPLATVGAVYLVGSAVASAAPTPGGLGAVEAALISGLVAAGLDNAVAVPAVFLFRLATFWLPILPGWLSFRWLQRHDYL